MDQIAALATSRIAGSLPLEKRIEQTTGTALSKAALQAKPIEA